MSELNAATPDANATLAKLVERHAEFLFRSLRRLGVADAECDDALQQVFLIVRDKLHAIEPDRERGYLFGIAANVAAHARRKVARAKEVPDETVGEPIDLAVRADVLLEQKQARAMLDEVLDSMENDLRVVFVLFELEELTMVEIATTLSLPPGTVASRLRRAREGFHRAAQRTRARLELVRLAQPASSPGRPGDTQLEGER